VVRSVPGMARAREISGRPVFCTARLPIACWVQAGSGAHVGHGSACRGLVADPHAGGS
jgi:hypothetical protein